MTRRVLAVAVIGLLTVVAVPSFAFAQDEQGSSGESPATGAPAGTEGSDQGPPSTPPEPVTPDPPVVSEQTEQQDASGKSEEPETDAIEPQVASSDDTGFVVETSSADVTAPVASTSAATVSGTNKIRNKKSSKKGKKARASCKSSSRAGGPLAGASAPPAAGCTRLNGNGGVLIAPDGTTLTIVETSQGVIEVTVSGAPGGTYSGTLFVKGGPNALGPGNTCVFNAVPNGTTQVCTGNINPNNGNFYGVSHVDACPPGVTPDVPGTTTTPGGSSRGGGQRDDQKRKKKAAGQRSSVEPVAAATAVAAPGGQLPVTGLPVAWLLLVGGGLLASGFAIRRMV